ncbi:MAG: hypothetical protein SOV63_06495 [Pyramidobacter porci]|uniref:hypothetical protein n=1 Tax=Pyramidobacter porci TaxID=2605789 RepID=UPI002A748A3F|nr:hypothetical protein [Pyramidobacter porci]MCI6260108.1 hypothetical protein [Pyramidobacter sp.]MDY2648440.1 hypothetical protein [Pyramidobacter porci]
MGQSSVGHGTGVWCALSWGDLASVENDLFVFIEEKAFYAIRGVQYRHAVSSFLKGGVGAQVIVPPRACRYFFVREKERMKLPSYFYGIFALTLCAHSLISIIYVLPSLPLPIGGVSKRMRLDGVLAAIGCFAAGASPAIYATLWRYPPLRAQTSKEAEAR